MLLALLTAAASCIDPSTYGAVANDGKPDTDAIQKAIDAAAAKGGKVCLGKGVFHVEKVREFASLLISKGPVEIYGTGPETVLRMTGSGGHDDWRAIRILRTGGVYLHDFKIDGLDAYDTEEQTHLIEIAPESSDITIANMALGPMRKPGQPIGKGIGGDCIRILGKLGGEVEDVTIVNTKFVDCDRSGISLQRSLRRIVIANDTFERTGDQGIDFEPTGKGSIEDVVISRVTVKHDPTAQGSDAITIGGHGPYPARRITVVDSKIEGGGIRMIDAEDVVLLRNTIDYGARNKAPTINIMRRVANVRIAKNTITRPAGAEAGPVLAATHLAKHVPHGIAFEDNVVRQETPAIVVNMTSVGGVSVRRNKITYTGADRGMPIVNVVAVFADVEDVAVTDNEVTGDAGAIVSVKNAQHVIRRVEVGGNQAPKTPTSVECKGKPDGFDDIQSDGPATQRAACRGVKLVPMRARPVGPKSTATP
ncbi:MAG TPA: right-handed parallel beta-helix repeat-containing protein [Kofleriaceae bacterium]|nr:right-handed parallel beta-helix repeat-containing protein [Kofleriaceae bacterium]